MATIAASRSSGDAFSLDLAVGAYQVVVATGFGPRLLGLRYRNGPELFARLSDDVAIEHPDAGTYRFHGGHRVWAAPEVPRITYAGDDHRCDVKTAGPGFSVKAPADAAGLVKEIEVTPDGERLLVDHRLTNSTTTGLSVAAWGITQFPLGGVAILPLGGSPAADAYQADRSLLLWPYTNVTDPRLTWTEGAALVKAVAGPRFKIGVGPRPGRLGYHKDGYLFAKEVPSADEGEYPDRGAVGQVFVEASFCELESAGAIAVLLPGSSVAHREVWEVTECADLRAACRQLMGGPTT